MTETDSSLLLDNQLCFTVYAAAHAFTAAYKPLLEPFGLTYPQYLVLLVLWEQDGVSLKEIGRRLQLDAGTLTPLLKRLEAGGYVRRQRDPGNERQLRLELTKAGRSLRGQIGVAREQIVCALGGCEEPIQKLRHDLQSIIPQLRTLDSKRIVSE